VLPSPPSSTPRKQEQKKEEGRKKGRGKKLRALSPLGSIPHLRDLRSFGMLGFVVGASNALVVPQAPLVPGSAVTARTAAPLMEAGGKLRAGSLAERRKMKLETGEGLRSAWCF
jgi:hypothetical protein